MSIDWKWIECEYVNIEMNWMEIYGGNELE